MGPCPTCGAQDHQLAYPGLWRLLETQTPLIESHKWNGILIESQKWNDILIESQKWSDILIESETWNEILIDSQKWKDISKAVQKAEATSICAAGRSATSPSPNLLVFTVSV